MSLYRFLEFELDEAEFSLSRHGNRLTLEPRVLRVLLVLVRKAGRLVEKQEIIETVWLNTFVEDNSLTRAIGHLRRELGDDSRDSKIIETIPTRGYRFIAPVEIVGPTEQLLTPERNQPDALAHGRSKNRRMVILAVSAAVLLAVTIVVARTWRTPHNSPIHSLAVLPLDDLSPDQNEAYFAEGLTDELITELAQIPELRVVSRTSAMQEKGKRKTVAEIAGDLGVDAIVEGSVFRSGDRVRITAQLVDARSDHHLWAQSFEGNMGNILALQDGIAREIAARTRTTLSPSDRVRLNNATSIKPEAYDNYLHGLYFTQRRDGAQAARYLREALRLEPVYAPAWAGLSRALDTEFHTQVARGEDVESEALSAAKKAIQIDPSDGEGYISLGSIEFSYLRDWPAAERDLRRGITLSPNDSSGFIYLSLYLLTINRTEEAISAARRALQLDPVGFFTNRNLAAVLFYSRKYEESLAALRRAQEISPDLSVENWYSYVYEAQGRYADAADAELREMSADHVPVKTISALRVAFKAGGWKQYQQTLIRILLPDSRSCTSWNLAMAYVELQDASQAFRWFQQAADERCVFTINLATDPRLDPFRHDRHYLEFQDRLNLPH